MKYSVLAKLKEWKISPLRYVVECVGATPTKHQIEGLKLLPKKKRISIRSGHGTGKDAFAAWAAMWFSSTRTYPKVPCVAPTARQLSDVLWSELSKWIRQSKVADEFVIQKDKIFHKAAPKEWWMRAISPAVRATKEEQAETLAGLHADHMLIIADEASGIPDPMYIPLEGAMTQPDNKVILIGNMTRNTGYFFKTHFDPIISEKWGTLHWDSRDSEIVTEDMIQYFRDNYGEDSNVFRIRVAGDPPLDDEMTFIPLSWAIQCVGNTIEVDPDWPLYLSVDVARYGEDDSIILPRRGMKVSRWDRFHGNHTMDLAHHIVRNFNDMEAKGAGVDEIGVGGGVVDWLQNDPRGLGYERAIGINVTEASSDKMQWHRLRDELWDRVRTHLMKSRFDLPDETVKMFGKDWNIGHLLANELAAPRYKMDNNGAIQIESKMDMKARGLKSTNIADALCMSEYFNSVAYHLWGPKQQARKRAVAGSQNPGPSEDRSTQQYNIMHLS
jgi:hypothetical protein